MRVTIEKLIYGGEGLARLPADERGNGKAFFVPFVLAGEQVDASVTEQKPGFARGKLERIIGKSHRRREPPCPYFQRCGGCHYQHTDYAHQLEIKAEILRETLRRFAKLELPCELSVHASPEWNYRNRTRLKIETAPEFAVGYYRFRSHQLFPVDHCPISSPLINRAIAALWQAGRVSQTHAALREIEFFADHNDSALLVEAHCAPGTPRADVASIAKSLNLMSEVRGVAVFEQVAGRHVVEPAKVGELGDTRLQYQTTAGPYRVSAGSFFQVNRFLLDELTAAVCTAASGTLALDLYAGAGFFSKVLGRSFPQVIAVEASQTAHDDLRHNCGPEVKAVLATTEQYLSQVSSELRPDLVVADPPRGGLGENVVRGLARIKAPRIVYVSCDPSTLARDLRRLVADGYRIGQAHLFDMFPQTYHIESVFHLAR